MQNKKKTPAYMKSPMKNTAYWKAKNEATPAKFLGGGNFLGGAMDLLQNLPGMGGIMSMINKNENSKK